MQTDLFQSAEHNTGADFSADRKYRYKLWRIWDSSKPMVAFVGLNPSTANEATNDHTIRKVIGFAKRWDMGGVYMLNCFPMVSTDPKALDSADLMRSDEMARNDRTLLEIGKACELVVFAWGAFEIVKRMGRHVHLAQIFPQAKALRMLKHNNPMHPLMCPYSVELVPYRFI